MLLILWILVLVCGLVFSSIGFLRSSEYPNYFPIILAGLCFLFCSLMMYDLEVYAFDTGIRTYNYDLNDWSGSFATQTFLFGIGFIHLINVFIDVLGWSRK